MSISDVIEEINKNKNKNLDNKELYELLINIFPKPNVELAMFEKFCYIHKKTEEKEKRKDQQSFRNDVIDRYNNCIITGCNSIVCEACHIIPHSECSEDIKYDVNNGLLFRVDLHKLFDNGNLKINPTTSQIELSNDILNDNTMKDYHKYNNKKINIHESSICFLNKLY